MPVMIMHHVNELGQVADIPPPPPAIIILYSLKSVLFLKFSDDVRYILPRGL